MPLQLMRLVGLRGYATPQTLELAVPNEGIGSGLTILVGPNAAGKSTLLEALQFLQRTDAPPPLPDSRRNAQTAGYVSVQYVGMDGTTLALETSVVGGGDPTWRGTRPVTFGPLWAVPPRRAMPDNNIQRTAEDRDTYVQRIGPGSLRSQHFGSFAARLGSAAHRATEFNSVFARIVDPPPQWYVTEGEKFDQSLVLRFRAPTGPHSTDGVSEGYASLFWIVDGLYASQPGDIIIVDEPELSLHPAVQRRLASVLAEYARDRQIVVATHSPYFADWSFIFGGAQLARVSVGTSGSRISSLTAGAVNGMRAQANDLNNPHVLGLDGREVFFLEDRVILCEGADDVITLQEIARQIGSTWGGDFYGWGVGGAHKMAKLARVLVDLGFERVCGILDAGQDPELASLSREFPQYHFELMPTRDVRTKRPAKARVAINGLVDEDFRLRPEHRTSMQGIIDRVGHALRRDLP